MKLGPLIRRFLPQAVEVGLAKAYRSVFVDLDKVARHLSLALPKNANVLDIGGGDGDLLNRLFALRPDIRVTMVDIAASVGRFVQQRYGDRVRLEPGTTIQDHVLALATPEDKYDAAIIIDVMHHIPMAQREAFLRAVHNALVTGGTLLVKDVEPGYFRAKLGCLCDRYISGDRGVTLVPADEVSALVSRIAPGCVALETGLFSEDRPNYLVKVGSA